MQIISWHRRHGHALGMRRECRSVPPLGPLRLISVMPACYRSLVGPTRRWIEYLFVATATSKLYQEFGPGEVEIEQIQTEVPSPRSGFVGIVLNSGRLKCFDWTAEQLLCRSGRVRRSSAVELDSLRINSVERKRRELFYLRINIKCPGVRRRQ